MGHIKNTNKRRKVIERMNVNKLKAKCIEKGVKIEILSKNVGISCSTFYRKMKEDSFSVEEARKIATHLELTHTEINEIFFGVSVA